MTDRRTAHWTRPRPEQQADPETRKPVPNRNRFPSQRADPSQCWANDCENQPAAQQSERWLGTYCESCLARLPSLVYTEPAE